MMMSKITAEHLARTAYVYIRQSHPHQVKHNLESQRRQYGLADRGRELGWSEITIIDEDQGHSGAGVQRSGFERLLIDVCAGKVGAVLCIEASRLARNGRDWHTLLEFCGLVNTLLIDENGIYDPRQPNDRLLLGMKGTISEMELSTFRQRAQGALDQKAKRGELHTTVPIGYVRSHDDRIEKDPDLRIQEAVALIFRKFRELASIRQVLIWIRQERIELPVIINTANERQIVWQVPVYNTIRHILKNPIYGGSYAFGRSKTLARIENGRKRLIRQHLLGQQDWKVLLLQHHEGYVSWDEYQRNQALIAQNANMKGSTLVQGAVKQGKALLSGLLRCGRCGRRLHAGYSGTRNNVIRYDCRARKGDLYCLTFGGVRADERVSEEVLRCLEPLGIQASLKAIEQEYAASDERIHQKELALQQASYEVAHARRQYDAVDPQNRLVAAELERRWNETLKVQGLLQEELEQLRQAPHNELSVAAKAELLSLGTDLPRLWNHPTSSPEIKKRILRTVLKEIVVNIRDNNIHMVLHWQGGGHTELQIAKNRKGQHRWVTDADTVELVRQLARVLPDQSIGAVLNRLNKRTAHGHNWTAGRVCAFRNDHAIPIYRTGEREARGELTLEETAAALNVSRMTVLRMIRSQVLPATQACLGAPWLIRKEDLQLRQEELKTGPRTSNPNQICMNLE
jgi:excisionase family DNA binding protein